MLIGGISGHSIMIVLYPISLFVLGRIYVLISQNLLFLYLNSPGTKTVIGDLKITWTVKVSNEEGYKMQELSTS